jgi:hypothetical protein
VSGGSSGGCGYQGNNVAAPLTQYNNYGNQGGVGSGAGSATYAGGGGGAGTSGTNAAGGNGIQCFLPGISTFAPNGTAYGTYYWGGGGGAVVLATGNSNNGGVGGGGGGASSSTSYPGGFGGIGGINSGVNGISNANGGNAGANTGGGGGGTYTSTSGSGGSGIVIIAFPQTPITSNAQAVLPSTLFSSGKAVDVLSYDTSFNGTKTGLLSSGAYASIKGAFSCKLVNYNYFGPVLTLRHSADAGGNYTQNFYADVSGNLGTGYLGTGQSVSAWLSANSANTTYAYVTKWYNQGMDLSFNAATQYTLSIQPIYEVPTGVINYGYTTGYTTGTNLPSWSANAGNAYLNLPNGAYPYNDTSFTVSFRCGGFPGPSVVDYVFYGGTNANYSGISAYAYNGKMYQNWWGNDYASTASFTTNSYFTMSYVSGSGIMTNYVNGGTGTTSAIGTAARTQPNGPNNHIGGSGGLSNGQFNGQMYNFYIFSTALNTGNDRPIIEATPYQYSALASITGLAASSVTATNFALSCSAVTGANQFVVFVNGSATYTSATGLTALSSVTITPGFPAPWNISVYAYNSSNVLLASGNSYNIIVAASSPTFFYPFQTNILDYATGWGVSDATLNGTTAITNAKSYKTGGGGSLYNPSSTSTNIVLPNTTINVTNGCTVSFWFYLTTTTAGMVWSLNSGTARTFIYSTGSVLRACYYTGSNDIVPFTVNAWTFLTFVIPSGGATAPYVVLNANFANPYTLTNYALTNMTATIQHNIFGDAAIGTTGGGALGYVNNFSFYPRQLSNTEILALYNQ